MPSPCFPPLASCVKLVITYLLSDFLGLWQAIQFRTRIGATSPMKLTGLLPPAWFSLVVALLDSGFAFVFAADCASSPRAGTKLASARRNIAEARSRIMESLRVFVSMGTSWIRDLTWPPEPSPARQGAKWDNLSCRPGMPRQGARWPIPQRPWPQR